MAGEEYIIMLRESLEKKKELLVEIQKKNELQAELFIDESSLPEDLDEVYEEKEKLINEIMALDDGFEALFAKVKKELDANRAQHAEEIKRMQGLISEITDLSNAIQAKELDNRSLASSRFASVKQQVQKVRKSQQAVHTYYKNMMKADYHNPQFLDHKE